MALAQKGATNLTRRYHSELSKEELVRIYDRAAPDYSARFSDPDAVAKNQLRLITRWGARIESGARVLEVGCADGYVTEQLVRAGLEVTAIDLSQRMLAITQERLDGEGLEADLAVHDIEESVPEGRFDVVVVLMRNFFSYIEDHQLVLRRLASVTRTKILVDCDPRAHDLQEAMQLLRDAGFERVQWRPSFVPQRFRLGRAGAALLRLAEHVPGLRMLILRKKFLIIIKGETPVVTP